MSQAQSLFILGGLINVFASIVVAYALYWVRAADPAKATGGGLTAHKVALWNGFLLFSFAVAIDRTGFSSSINTWLAAAEVGVCILASARTIYIWWANLGNVFLRGGLLVRTVGIGHVVDLVVSAGILYGVARMVLTAG